MKNEINKSEVKKFNSMAWLLTAMYIIMVVTPIPLIKYLGWIGGAIWGVIVAIAIITAIKVEKMKKANNIQTYKEIAAFMEGKPLDEISADRIKTANKTAIKFMYGVISALVALTVCVAIGYFIFN